MDSSDVLKGKDQVRKPVWRRILELCAWYMMLGILMSDMVLLMILVVVIVAWMLGW